MNIFEILRAKSDKEGAAKSLMEHIKDALFRAKALYDFVSSLDTDWITFNEDKEKEEFFKSLAKSIILHDFGKIDYQFQLQLFTKEGKENDPKWVEIKKFFSGDIRRIHFHRHEILSSIYASFLLDESDWSKKIMTAILLHHYNSYFTDTISLPEIIRDFEDDLKGYMNFIFIQKEIFKESYELLLSSLSNSNDFGNNPFIKEAIVELQKAGDWDKAGKLLNSYYDDDLSKFIDFYEPKNKLSDESKKLDEDTYRFLVFLGALRRADYSSSGGVPIEGNPPEKILKFYELAEKFKKKFRSDTLWQEEILKNKKSDEIKHLILISPTGSGKTEFSILWAAKNPRKLLYTLPLRVALNDLFMRFKGIEEKEEGYFKSEDVNILHSTAFIEYVRESEGRYLDIERKLTSSKLLSYPLMLTTPDQIFLTSLNYYGSDKVISVYPISNIVVDEIQTFNPEMAAVIIKTLKTVNYIGGNILVMTATFPPYFDKFLDELGFKKLDISKYENEFEIKNHKVKRHRINVFDESLFEYNKEDKGYEVKIKSEAEEKLGHLLTNKQNALLVVNNVKKAISIYKYLGGDKKEEIFLLHSRLIEKYKTEIISKIKEKLNKKEKVILVSTQIIEASVDLDFDFMITELSPIDSQIQRWGRVYRNRKTDYSNEDPNIIIFAGKINDNKEKEKWDNLEIDRGTYSIYDKKVLGATREVLKEYQNNEKALSYKEVKQMVEETFLKKINNGTLKEYYEREIENTLNFLDYFSASKKSEAQRIFRKMAGITAVVPSLMKQDDKMKENEKNWVTKLAEIIEKGQDSSWKEILKEIRETNEDIKNHWILKAEIYKYSVTVPEFALKKYGRHLSKEFKGFNVITVEKDDDVKNIREYGLDAWFENLEDEEIDDRFY